MVYWLLVGGHCTNIFLSAADMGTARTEYLRRMKEAIDDMISQVGWLVGYLVVVVIFGAHSCIPDCCD